ncbi:chlorophyll A-B binding protein [Aureococcus anophagefferens]|nr:chlorophyll A-B binding protein [Aureococcus anophagefferens]
MARLALALAATAATTSALVAPTAKKTVSATALNYDRAPPSSTQRRGRRRALAGPTSPTSRRSGHPRPRRLLRADAASRRGKLPIPDRALRRTGEPRGRRTSELKRYREAELTHGRVAMLASVGFLVGESGATPLFGGNIDGIAINQFWKVPTGFWPVILLFIAVPETFRALRGWMEPTVPENYCAPRGLHARRHRLGLCPEDPEEFKIMQTKELARPPRDARGRGHDRPGAPDGQHALLGAAPAPPDRIGGRPRTGDLRLARVHARRRAATTKAKHTHRSHATMARLAFALAATCASTSALVAPTAAKAPSSLHVATSYDPSDFSDVTALPGILAPVEFFDPLNFAADASESELKRYREAELTHGRVAMLASVGFLVGESGATPLFGGNIDGIAINQFCCS